MIHQPPQRPPTRISVIIPVYNHARFIGQALSSVFNQDVEDLDVLIVNDGSEDDLTTALFPFADRIRILDRPHEGISAARNAGLKAATGEWVAFLDADDLWTPDKLARQWDVLTHNPDIQVVYGHCVEFYDEELSDRERAGLPCILAPIASELPTIMLARKQVFDRVGSFDESYTLGMCIDWSLRCRDAGVKTHILPEVVYHRRLHTTNSSRRYKTANPQRLHALKAHLDRIRNKANGHD